MSQTAKPVALALTDEARVRLRDYMDRTGLNAIDVGHRVSYSRQAVNFFLAGTYSKIAKSRDLESAIIKFLDANPVTALAATHGDLYETENVRIIRQTFEKLLPRPVAYMLYGAPGNQKTFVLEHEVARLNQTEAHKNGHGHRAYYIYSRRGMTPREMVRRIATACASPTHGSIDRMLVNLRYNFAGRRVLLVADEAQNLSFDCLEVIRELLDQPPFFSLLFAGSHNLKVLFDQLSARLEQWNSRIIAKVQLPGLKREEARAIAWREIGGPLEGMTRAAADKLVESLIDSATTKDAFASNRTYINVRTLTNALYQIQTPDTEKTA